MRTGCGSSREWFFVWAWAVLVAGLMLVPYAHRAALPARWGAWQFTGIGSDYFDDTAWHLSWARQARDGFFLFESQYAGAETQGHRFFNLLFLSLGWFARLTGLTVVAAFHLTRTLVAALVLVGVYWVAREFFPDRRMRWVALVLVTLGGGVGFLPWPFEGGPLPAPELRVIETNTFWSLEWEVVVGPTTGLLLVWLLFAHRAVLAGGRQAAAAAALATLALACVHPHEVATVSAVMAAFVVVSAMTARSAARGTTLGRGVAALAIMLAAAAPLLLAHALVMAGDPSYLRYGLHYHSLTTASWLEDYGLILVAALVGAGAVVWRRERERAILVVFPMVLAAVMATPYPRIQRAHLHHGLQILLCLLATRGLWAVGAALVRRSARAGRRLAAVALTLFLLAVSPMNVLHYQAELAPVTPKGPWFLRRDEAAALTFLEAHARSDQVIACRQPVSAIVPTWTGSRVFVGLPDVTPEYPRRVAWMEELTTAADRQAAAIILRATRADYLYADPQARQMTPRAAERVFANQWTAVYRVRKNETADGRR